MTINTPAPAHEAVLTDDQIEALAKKHIAPHADRLDAIMQNPVPYQQTEQFRRVKALIVDVLSKLRAPVADESPMAKMADALREKARQEQQAYQDRRNQATEWGLMPEGTEADHPTPMAPVAHVAGDETSRYLQWAKDRSAWEMPVGTPVYYSALASAPVAGEAQPVAWLMKRHSDEQFEIAEPHEKASNPHWSDAFPVYGVPKALTVDVIAGNTLFDCGPEKEKVRGDDFDAWLTAQKLCKGTDIRSFRFERNGSYASLPDLLREAWEAAAASTPVAGDAVEFLMGDAGDIQRLLATHQISRRVDHPELGVMGAVEVTTWATKIGLALEVHNSNGGMSAYLYAAPQASKPDFSDAYEGAREDLAIWKRRALEAENLLRIERETSCRLVAELNATNGPAHMGEPAPQASEAVRDQALEDAAQAAYTALFPTNDRSDWTEFAESAAYSAKWAAQCIRALKSQSAALSAQPGAQKEQSDA